LPLARAEHGSVRHGQRAKLVAARILAAPWPPPFQLLIVPLSVLTKHGIAFSRSRHTSCIPLPVAFVTGAPRRLCHVCRRLLCSWPGDHGSSPGHPRPPAGARRPPGAPPPLSYGRQVSYGRLPRAPATSLF
jgi:hypothetical protein